MDNSISLTATNTVFNNNNAIIDGGVLKVDKTQLFTPSNN